MTTTNFIWDEQNYLADADATNTINVVYTNEPQLYGNLISTRLATTPVYHHFDVLGSTRQLSLVNGSVSDTAIYDAWGNLATRTGTTPVHLLWIAELGYYLDSETESAYVRTRSYRPEIARWCARGPRLSTHNVNLFSYTDNRPIASVNASGLGAPLGGASPQRESVLMLTVILKATVLSSCGAAEYAV